MDSPAWSEAQFWIINGNNRPLVTDERVELEKQPFEAQYFRRITLHYRRIYRIHPIQQRKPERRITTCNRLDLETLGVWPIMPKNLSDHRFRKIEVTSSPLLLPPWYMFPFSFFFLFWFLFVFAAWCYCTCVCPCIFDMVHAQKAKQVLPARALGNYWSSAKHVFLQSFDSCKLDDPQYVCMCVWMTSIYTYFQPLLDPKTIIIHIWLCVISTTNLLTCVS